LPWQAIRNPKTIETDAGDRIMVDGWFGIVHKPGSYNHGPAWRLCLPSFKKKKPSIVHYSILMVSVRNSHAV
jgi:hypothetical protein